jgi:hypothetical protein
MTRKYPSPADIEQMRARSDDPSAIRQAEELSKRWHEANEIAARIREAFRGVTLRRGVGLRQGQGLDDYADKKTIEQYRESDEKDDWSSISAAALNECYTSLSFFDAEGMRFHLPAYLLADLAGEYQQSLVFHLMDLGDYGQRQFALLSPLQVAAVRAYLQFIADDEDYAFERPKILQAISDYWTE